MTPEERRNLLHVWRSDGTDEAAEAGRQLNRLEALAPRLDPRAIPRCQ